MFAILRGTGIKGIKELTKIFSTYTKEIQLSTHNIEISLNIDGLQSFESCHKTSWPVLCVIHLQPTIVFPVVFSYGRSKP